MKFFSWLWLLLPQKKQQEHLLESDIPVTKTVRTIGIRDRFRLIPYGCGHKDVRQFHLLLRGQAVDLTDAVLAKREQCGDCMLAHARKTVIHCAWCDALIAQGDGVSLCTPHPDMKGARTFVETPSGQKVVGCMLIGCAPDMDAWAGNWDGTGIRRPKAVPFADGIEIKPDAQGELYPRITNVSAAHLL